MNAERRPRIVHWHLGPVFELSENWLYRQFILLKRYDYLYYSLGRINRGLFPDERIRALAESGTGLRALNRLLRLFRDDFLPIRLWLRRDRPALVHAHFGTGGYWAMRHISGACPLVVSFYGADAYVFDRSPEWLANYRSLFGRGALFLAEGPAMAGKLASLGCPVGKIRIHPVGIQTELYRFAPRGIDTGSAIRLLVVGRFVEKKGIPFAVQALRLVRRRFAEATLTIVGGAPENPAGRREQAQIMAAIREGGLEAHVRLEGWLAPDSLQRLADDHHILLVPSVFAADGDAEGGHPVILTEMMARGLAVAAFDHCDINQAVVDGMTGLLAPMKDVAALAAAICRLAEDAPGRERMGRAARRHVEERYDLGKLNERLEDYYEELLEK
ncbi:MAG: glycosyltransferase [Candidatus Aminicenantes bacterium]|nr:glycosyltransferase [Candidatus Aminicenantes bacterium]